LYRFYCYKIKLTFNKIERKLTFNVSLKAPIRIEMEAGEI